MTDSLDLYCSYFTTELHNAEDAKEPVTPTSVRVRHVNEDSAVIELTGVAHVVIAFALPETASPSDVENALREIAASQGFLCVDVWTNSKDGRSGTAKGYNDPGVAFGWI